MPPVLSVCADCERRILHRPKTAQALSEALGCLVRMLVAQRRFQDLEVVRTSCDHACPLGRICVTLRQEGCETRHPLGTRDDLKVVARRLAARRPKAEKA